MKIFMRLGVFFVLFAVSGFCQQPTTAASAVASDTVSAAAASRTDMDCSGFIAPTKVPKDIFVFDGTDNDFQSRFRLYTTGNFVYLHGKAATGAEYALVRPAKRQYTISWYQGQRSSIRTLGHPYEDVGRLRVISQTPQGAVAQVTATCGGVTPGDIAVPYQQRAIPEYNLAQNLERFAPKKQGRLTGAITAAASNAGFLGAGSIAYLNLGSTDAVRPGQRFRIFRVFRDRVERSLTAPHDTPLETVGELVVISAQEKSSVAVVVNSLREIGVGDGIELE